MFEADEADYTDLTDKSEFDRANNVLLKNNLQLGENIDYRVYEVPLGTAHTNEALGLLTNGIIADSFTVLSAPNTATIRINSPSADAITAIQGWRRQGIFRELYITNAVAGGTLQIEVTWSSQDKIKIDEAAEMISAKKDEQAIIQKQEVAKIASVKEQADENIAAIREQADEKIAAIKESDMGGEEKTSKIASVKEQADENIAAIREQADEKIAAIREHRTPKTVKKKEIEKTSPWVTGGIALATAAAFGMILKSKEY